MRSLRMEVSLENVELANPEHLEIYSSLESTSDDRFSLRTSTFPLHFFPTLMTLEFIGFGNLEMISCDRTHNNVILSMLHAVSDRLPTLISLALSC